MQHTACGSQFTVACSHNVATGFIAVLFIRRFSQLLTLTLHTCHYIQRHTEITAATVRDNKQRDGAHCIVTVHFSLSSIGIIRITLIVMLLLRDVACDSCSVLRIMFCCSC